MRAHSLLPARRPTGAPVDFIAPLFVSSSPADARPLGALDPASDATFRTLADAIPTLAWTARADGYIDWYNARWYAYTGTTPDEMEGWGWQRVHDPAVLPDVLTRWQASIATGEPFEMTFPLRGADGVFRPFLTRVAPVRDADGRVARWFGTNTDLTPEREAAGDRDRLLAELAARNERLEEQGRELAFSNQQLQEQATELEVQTEELQATTAHLEEQAEAIEQGAAALRASEERYQLAARATRNAIWDWDLVTNAVRWSPGIHEAFAHPPGAVEGTAAWWYDTIHPDDRDRVVGGIHRVIDDPLGGSAWQDAYRFRRGRAPNDEPGGAPNGGPDGAPDYAQVLDRGYVVRGADGRPLRMIGAMEDVSESRAAAAALARQLAESEALYQAAPVGLAVFDRELRYVRVNARLAEINGVPAEAHLGRTPSEVIPDLAPQAEALVRRVFETGEPVTDVEVAGETAARPGARRVWRAQWVPVRDASGSVVRVHVVAEEVTAEHAANAERARLLAAEREAHAAAEAERAAADLGRRQLDAVLEALPVGVIVAEAPSGRLVFSNAAVARIWGQDRSTARVDDYSVEWTGYHVDADGRATDRAYQSHEWPLARAVSAGESVTDEPVEVARPDGSRVRVNLSAAPIRDANGALVGGVVVSVDVSEAAQARAALAAARDAAEAANQAKSQFLANMSHELRTPLNAIGGYAQLLDMGLHGPVTDEQRGALARVQAAQARLLGLINDVLNYAKLEGGRVEYDVRPVDVADVVGDVAPLVEPQFRAKGLAFDVRLPDTPCVVLADREKLGQVLVNLLSNAVKFTPSPHPRTGAPGRVTVRVRPAADDDGGRAFARLEVEDTGIGIPADKHDGIFEPFVQVRSGYAQATEGTGLGLAISRDLARGMGGDLQVYSREGEGATFAVTLRRADAGVA